MQKHISSLQNPLIKQVVSLSEKSRERKKQERFLVEGVRETKLALKGGFALEILLFCEAIMASEDLQLLQKEASNTVEIISVSKEVYDKIAYRTSTEGVVAIFRSKEKTLQQLQFNKENPLILVAEAPEKPGNIGALLRTADAANLDVVIIANPKTDLFNPNIIRSSVGCVFTNQVAMGTTAEIIQFLTEKNIAIYSAALQASVNYDTCTFKNACAIVVGTEADGLTSEWLEQSTQNIKIPMQGEIDSMNVSVAAGILIFEAKRQRNFQ